MSRRLQISIGLLLAVAFGWLFLRQADFDAVVGSLRTAAPLPLIAAALLVIAATALRAWRWGQLLEPVGRPGLRPLFEATLMGWAVVLVAGRVGEIVRPVLLSRRSRVGAMEAIGSVVLERLLDIGAVLFFLAVYLAFFPPPAGIDLDGEVLLGTMRSVGLGALAGLAAGGALAVAILRSATARRRLSDLATRFLPGRLGGLARAFVRGLASLRSPWLLARLCLSSLAVWGVILAGYVVQFHAFHLDLAWASSIPLLFLLVLGVAVPTPGAIGSFHAAAQIGLVNLLGVDNDTAVAFALVSHVLAFAPAAGPGFLLLARDGVTLAAARTMGDQAEGEAGL